MEIVHKRAIEKIEAALTLWNEESNQKRIPLSGAIRQEKMKHLYEDFKDSYDEYTEGEF